MIFNLISYLRTQLPSLTFISEGENYNEEGIRVTQTGGEDNHDIDRIDFNVQLLSKYKKLFTSKNNIDSVYAILKNRFGLILPEVIIGALTYPEVTTYRIVPMQIPGYLGTDDNGYHMYSFNIIVTTK